MEFSKTLNSQDKKLLSQIKLAINKDNFNDAMNKSIELSKDLLSYPNYDFHHWIGEDFYNSITRIFVTDKESKQRNDNQNKDYNNDYHYHYSVNGRTWDSEALTTLNDYLDDYIIYA